MEQISPELALVDPELARRARALLPERHDWTIDFAPREREREPPPRRHWPATPLLLVLLLGTAAVGVAFFRPVSQRPHLAPAARTAVPARTQARPERDTRPARARHAAAGARRARRTGGAPPHARVVRLMHDAIGERVGWAVARLGPGRTGAVAGTSCELRWSSLRLTLFVALDRPGQPCRSGRIVGGAQRGGARGA